MTDWRKVTWCNSGLMAINGRRALDLLTRSGNNNAKGEYYLTDIVEIARSLGGKSVAIDAPESELIGCNNRAELAYIEKLCQERARGAGLERAAQGPVYRRSLRVSISQGRSAEAGLLGWFRHRAGVQEAGRA